MIKHLTAIGLVMAALVKAAGAVVTNPGSVAVDAGSRRNCDTDRMVCGPDRCVWRSGWRSHVPAWAVWGPPRLPGCYYERQRHGWVEVCV